MESDLGSGNVSLQYEMKAFPFVNISTPNQIGKGRAIVQELDLTINSTCYAQVFGSVQPPKFTKSPN